MDRVNELQGKVAIVTGSARNIGRATAEELARAGAAAIINAVQGRDRCEEVAAGRRARGGQALAVLADWRRPEDIERMAQAAIAEFGGTDILSAQRRRAEPAQLRRPHARGLPAGPRSVDSRLLPPRQGGRTVDARAWRRRHHRCRRPELLPRPEGPLAPDGGQGRPEHGHPRPGLDLAGDNITANQVVVGTYDTRDADEAFGSEQLAARLARIPLGREGLPQDTADLIRFLVGPAGHYITGQTIHSNGGVFLNA